MEKKKFNYESYLYYCLLKNSLKSNLYLINTDMVDTLDLIGVDKLKFLFEKLKACNFDYLVKNEELYKKEQSASIYRDFIEPIDSLPRNIVSDIISLAIYDSDYISLLSYLPKALFNMEQSSEILNFTNGKNDDAYNSIKRVLESDINESLIDLINMKPLIQDMFGKKECDAIYHPTLVKNNPVLYRDKKIEYKASASTFSDILFNTFYEFQTDAKKRAELITKMIKKNSSNIDKMLKNLYSEQVIDTLVLSYVFRDSILLDGYIGSTKTSMMILDIIDDDLLKNMTFTYENEELPYYRYFAKFHDFTMINYFVSHFGVKDNLDYILFEKSLSESDSKKLIKV